MSEQKQKKDPEIATLRRRIDVLERQLGGLIRDLNQMQKLLKRSSRRSSEQRQRMAESLDHQANGMLPPKIG